MKTTVCNPEGTSSACSFHLVPLQFEPEYEIVLTLATLGIFIRLQQTCSNLEFRQVTSEIRIQQVFLSCSRFLLPGKSSKSSSWMNNKI